ncbi:MAG: TSCPD domain-containing protein [Treponema sp.]|nr:TSCPD domain-containing protein [Treponema sp.]
MGEGTDAQELVKKLKGVRCGFKQTSCPDQLTTAVGAEAKAKAEAR